MSKAYVFILIYALIYSTLIIDKDVLYHLYILSFCMKKNEIICHIKTTIV